MIWKICFAMAILFVLAGTVEFPKQKDIKK